jgi:hypothetical protein
MALRLEPFERKASQKAQQDAAKKGGKEAGKGRPKNRYRSNWTKPKQDNSKRTDAKLAKAVGVSRKTLAKAKEIVKSKNKSLIAEMNRTGKVDRAYRKLNESREAAALRKARKQISAQAKQDISSVCQIRMCSMQELLPTVKDLRREETVTPEVYAIPADF